MSKIDNVNLQNVTTVEELRQNTEVAINRIIAQLNASKITEDKSYNDHRITNVGYPVELHDAVNIEFLKDALGKIRFPLSKQAGGGGGDANNLYDKATFGLGIDSTLVVALDVAPHYIVAANNLTLVRVYAQCFNAPTGADIVFQINKHVYGGGTINVKSSNFVIPDGSSDILEWSMGATPPYGPFDVTSFGLKDYLSVDVNQVGSTTPGGDLIVVMKFKVEDAAPLT